MFPLVMDLLFSLASEAAPAVAGGLAASAAEPSIGSIAGAAAPTGGVTGLLSKMGTLGTKVMGNNFAGRLTDAALTSQIAPYQGLLSKGAFSNVPNFLKTMSPFMSPEDRYSTGLLSKATGWQQPQQQQKQQKFQY